MACAGASVRTGGTGVGDYRQGVRAPETIVCVDCGGTCHLLAHPETEFGPGDPVAYRCADCMDRWDLVMPDDEDDGRGDGPPGH